MAQTGYYDRDRTNPAPAGQMNHPTTHVGNTAEYMSSGYPFFQTINTATAVNDELGNPQTIDDGDIISMVFPYVTRWIMITGMHVDVKVAYDECFVGVSETGVGTNVSPGPNQVDLKFIDGVRLEMKCSKLYFRIADLSEITHIQVIAGLTNVPGGDFDIETVGTATNIGVDKAATVIMELNA